MCENWDKIVAEYEKDIKGLYSDESGEIWRFFGLVHSDDDYYYGMINVNSGKMRLCSCVGSLTGEHSHGFLKLNI